jgi:hypothetical protein
MFGKTKYTVASNQEKFYAVHQSLVLPVLLEGNKIRCVISHRRSDIDTVMMPFECWFVSIAGCCPPASVLKIQISRVVSVVTISAFSRH